MSTRLLGVHVSDGFHNAAHMTAKCEGLTLKDWLVPIIARHLDPEVASIFLANNAQQTKQERLESTGLVFCLPKDSNEFSEPHEN